ncbi:hypothetical protein NIIDMKKI_34020 [Mycobacterium kansasii]|uniref:Uncharacterized protein n=1 Tax=Mycobacterium kansasii TaxID=1768 RepID=A0A7G1IAX6_MYCKA|nr:hypothetical protein NIIDMKKI_34020 [Mycobacterium kansasii]
MSLVGMEFAGPADFGDTAPINDSDEEMLAGLAERLHAHGKIDRFGVRLIRNPLGLSETKVFSETCDPWRRALHCDVIDRAQTPDNAIETYWQWKPTPTETGPTATLTFLTGCRQFCTPSAAACITITITKKWSGWCHTNAVASNTQLVSAFARFSKWLGGAKLTRLLKSQ